MAAGRSKAANEPRSGTGETDAREIIQPLYYSGWWIYEMDEKIGDKVDQSMADGNPPSQLLIAIFGATGDGKTMITVR